MKRQSIVISLFILPLTYSSTYFNINYIEFISFFCKAYTYITYNVYSYTPKPDWNFRNAI
jgi:hypothetical protein